MQVIHFTEGATDPLQGFGAQRAKFVPLADGTGDTHVSCLYLDAGAQIPGPPCTHDCTLLIVHGQVIFRGEGGVPRLDLSPGVGLVMKAGQHYTLKSAKGGIALLIESDSLAANARGISTPDRIMGQRWPGEPDGLGGVYRYPSGQILDGSTDSCAFIGRRDP
jgi:hypothetical protein